MGKLIRGSSKNARFFAVETKDIVQRAMDIEGASATAIAALGRLLTATIMIGSDLKGEDDRVTLKINGDGPFGTLIATSNKQGTVKGYISNPKVDLEINPENNKLDVGRGVGKGNLQVIKDLGLKTPFSGISNLQTGEIAEDLAYYFFTSEQIPSVVALGVKVNVDYKIEHAGGYIIQLLPNAEDEFIDKLEEKIKSIRSVTELFEGGFDIKRIIHLIYEDMEDENHEKLIEPYEILEEKDIEYKCDCSKEKYLEGLITLGENQIKKIIEEDGKITVDCHFCEKTYDYFLEDFENIF